MPNILELNKVAEKDLTGMLGTATTTSRPKKAGLFFHTPPVNDTEFKKFYAASKSNDHLILKLAERKYIKEYAMWLFLKRIFTNGIIYTYSLSRLSLLTGKSRNFFRRYMNFFIHEGWVKVKDDGHLYFISSYRIYRKYVHHTKMRVTYIQGDTLNDLVINLRFHLPKIKQDRFDFVKQIFSNHVLCAHASRGKIYKVFEKYKTDGAEWKFDTENLVLSAFTLGKISGLSPSYSIKWFEKNGAKVTHNGKLRKYIKVQREKYHVLKKGILPPNTFMYKGRLFSLPCNEYRFKSIGRIKLLVKVGQDVKCAANVEMEYKVID